MVEENAVKRKRFAIGIIIACLAVIGVYIYNFHVNPKDIFQVSMTFYDVMNQEPIADVSVAVARCNGNRVEQEIITDEEGRVVFNLPRGKYTFCWSREGYCDDSRDIAVREERALTQYLVPVFGKNEAYIIAEWDFDADLDLCVYSGQEERCIVRDGLSEGDHVLGDIADRNYELAYLKDYRHTDYAVFLKDYSASQGAEGAEPGSVDIRMYTSGTFPYHERAVLEMQEVPEEGVALYECVRINGGAMEESGRYIEDLSGYSWAVRDKNDPAGWIGESTVQAKETYTYDALGKVSNIECWEYNENGRVIRSVGYNRYKKLDREYTAVYDEDGRIVKSTSIHYDDEYTRYERLYDAWGTEVVENRYNADGSFRGGDRKEIQYSENGDVLSERKFYIDSEGRQIPSWESTYDENGDLTSLHDYERGVLVRQMESEYDESGKLKRRWWGFYHDILDRAVYAADGDRLVSEYDADGKETYFVYKYNEDGELALYIKAYYDEDGHEILRQYYDEDGQTTSWYETQYNAEGQEISYCEYWRDGTLEYGRRTEYGANRKTVYRYEDGDWRLWIMREYTAEGWPETEYKYRSDGKTLDYKEMWEYNADGEWTLHACTSDLVSWDYRDEWTFDERGNETANYHYKDDMVLKYGVETEYDPLDNITVQRWYNSDGTVKVTNYTIIYDAAAGTVTKYKEEEGMIKKKEITRYY